MPKPSKVEIVDALLAALNSGELDDRLIEAKFAQDLELLDFPDAPGRRVYRGHDGVREFLSDMGENWSEMQIEVDEIREEEGNVLVLGTQTAVGALRGTPVSSDFGEVVEFEGDRIVRVSMFRDRDQTLAALENA